MVQNPMLNTLARAIAPLLLLALLGSGVPALAQSVADGEVAAQQGDPARAIEIWTPLAEAGDPQAQYWLAESHWGGWWGGPEALDQVGYWHTQAAEQGYVPSFVKLGGMYQNGWHFAQDNVRSTDWYHRAAEAGNADGQYFLGDAFYSVSR